ncbi:MAG: hypothetical protein ACE5Q6_22425 [Dehalococcoidia bacterium]
MGRVGVLPLFDPSSEDVAQKPGVVTIMVIPASLNYDTPSPDQFFLEAVCDHLRPRRLVTTELYVRGPEYVDIWVSVVIEVLGGYGAGPVREAVRQELSKFLSPLYGGHNGKGWLLNVPVQQLELEAVVARVEGVRLVPRLELGARTDNASNIPMEGLMLPRLRGVAVTEGDFIPLSQLRNAPVVTGGPLDGPRWTPIPVFPQRC